LARYAADHHKPLVLAANKWDLAADQDPEAYARSIAAKLPGLAYVPVLLLSAQRGERVGAAVALARELHRQGGLRIATGPLNRTLEEALQARPPSADGHRVRIYYATQTRVHPPTFTLFVNERRLFGKDTLRYIENRLRASFEFQEIPLRLV